MKLVRGSGMGKMARGSGWRLRGGGAVKRSESNHFGLSSAGDGRLVSLGHRYLEKEYEP